MSKILVTGASSGIGLSTAVLFLERGHFVVLADKVENSQLLSELKDMYNEAFMFVKTDVSRDGDVRHLYKTVKEKIGAVDCIVNNAGVISHGFLHEENEEAWDNLFNTDVKSIYFTTKYFIPDMIKNRYGVIVNISSISGLGGDYEMPIYNAAKGAVVNLTRAMAVDYAPYGIRVNAVCPGAVRTNMLKPENVEKYANVNLMKGICEPIEIARAVYFLASDEASYCNGVNLPVTGGLDIQTGQPK